MTGLDRIDNGERQLGNSICGRLAVFLLCHGQKVKNEINQIDKDVCVRARERRQAVRTEI